MVGDKIDRGFLTHSIDTWDFYLDPQEQIEGAQVAHAAKKLSLSHDEIRRRYEALARRLPLRLAWVPEEVEKWEAAKNAETDVD